MNASPAILIGASIPRSGHHYLARTLRRYFGERLHYCEFYNPADCCRRIPCTKRGTFDIVFQKNHDFDMALNPAIPGATYVIQHRHPVPEAASDWELAVKEQLGPVSATYRATREHYASWLARKAIYYRRFHDKWVVGQPAGAFRFEYEDLRTDTFAKLAPVVRAVAGEIDEARLTATIAASSAVRANVGAPFKPRQVDASSFPHQDLIAAFEDHVLRHCPAFGYAPMFGGGYDGSLLQGVILAFDPSEPLPAGCTDREDAVTALAGRHPELRLRRARALLDAKKPAEAAALLESTLADSPYFTAAWQPLYRAWREAGVSSSATMATADVMFDAMHDPLAVLALARIWRDDGRVAAAAAAMLGAVGFHPARAAPRSFLATLFERLGRRADAIAQAQAALSLDASDAMALALLERLKARTPQRG